MALNKERKEQLIKKVLPNARDREQLFREIYEKSADAVFVVDPEGIVKFLNPAAENLLDVPAEQMVGNLFRFRDYNKQPREVEIVRPCKNTLLAEIQTSEIHLSSGNLFVSILRDITELVRLREKLRAFAYVDELTGLCNRQGFLTLAHQQLKIASRSKKWLFFLLAHVNHMNWINDAFGNIKGDQTLIKVSTIFKETFRNADIIGRIGDHDFAALALEAHYSSSHIMSTRLQENLDNHNLREQRLYRLSLSIGTSFFTPELPCSIDELISRAEASMQAHKKAI